MLELADAYDVAAASSQQLARKELQCMRSMSQPHPVVHDPAIKVHGRRGSTGDGQPGTQAMSSSTSRQLGRGEAEDAEA